MPLLQYFLLLLPYKVTTISIALSKSEVIARLSDRFIPEAVSGENNFWSFPSRYVGHDLSDRASATEPYRFQIDGPFGNKKWTLSTEIKIVSTSQGSALKLRLTLALSAIFCAIFALVFYLVWAILFIKLPFLQIILLQELFLYGVIVFAFNYEAEILQKLIKDALQKTTYSDPK